VPRPVRRCTIPQQPAKAKRKRVTGADRRRLILSGARDAFLASGYAGARTKDIAVRAGITEAVIYRHFSSKEELFEQAILSPLEDWIASIPAAAEKVRTALSDTDRLAVTRSANATLLQATSDVLPLLGLALFSSIEQGEGFYCNRLAPLLEHLTELVAASLEGWDHRDIDPSVWVMAAWGFCLASAADSYFRGVSVDIDETAKSFTDILVRGGAPRARREAS
jgi:TetR/AcrR family transcriptional regulator